MVLKIKQELKDLLTATNLGQSRDHPLAGWNVLTILYGNRISLDTPRTFKLSVTSTAITWILKMMKVLFLIQF
jgi:hypothetical protein